VRGPGKSSGAFAFALILLVLFASRRKEQQSATTRKKRPDYKLLNWNTYKEVWNLKVESEKQKWNQLIAHR
jgi:hypothetical protein